MIIINLYKCMRLKKILPGFVIVSLAVIAIAPHARAQQANSNLITNPGLESVDTGGDPVGWQKNSWGDNETEFVYPQAGRNGGSAVGVNITSYSSGDAKWYFDDVAALPGQEYEFSDYYRSDAKSEVNVRYTYSDGSYGYFWLDDLPASSDWQMYVKRITVPENVMSITVFHLLSAVGSLSIDDVHLAKAGDGSVSPAAFPEGMVSFTFDDAWYSQYENAVPILDEAGIDATFFIVSSNVLSEQPAPPATGGNLIPNPSLEEVFAGFPENWNSNSWGENQPLFEYPVAGRDGGNAARVTIDDYVSGDGKWYFDEVPVTGGETYNFSDWYTSDIQSEIVLRHTDSDGDYSYKWIKNLPASPGWKKYEKDITLPAGATASTVFHLLASAGSLTVDDFSFTGSQGENGSPDRVFISQDELARMNESGHEIANHTRSHKHLTQVGESEAMDDVVGGYTDMVEMGLPAPVSFAYPYGEYNEKVKAIVQDAGHSGARGVDRGFNNLTADKYALKIQQVDRNTSSEDIKAWLGEAAAQNLWLILMFHQVDGSGAEYGTTPDILAQSVDHTQAIGLKAVTMSEGLRFYE